MPSSSTIEKRSSARLLLALSALSLGCSRNETPARAKSEPPPVASTPEPALVPSETAAALPSPDATGGPPAPAAESGPPAPAGAALAPLDSVSAEQLLAEVRRFGGKGTLVNAWASWCGPCKHEIPMLEKLAKKYASAGIHVVLVSLDEPADREKAAAFLTERKLALTSYLAERPLGPFKQGMNPRWPGMLPASFLYDSTGALRFFWGGEAFEQEVAPVLEAFAAGKAIQGEAAPAIAPE
ncbi:MAG TPA: TlpA disulfide reductase family protein [Polyangiaceae bacterium]|nr:TlpA disulfide reductase family protein [Polyangiaceae bacterium]